MPTRVWFCLPSSLLLTAEPKTWQQHTLSFTREHRTLTHKSSPSPADSPPQSTPERIKDDRTQCRSQPRTYSPSLVVSTIPFWQHAGYACRRHRPKLLFRSPSQLGVFFSMSEPADIPECYLDSRMLIDIFVFLFVPFAPIVRRRRRRRPKGRSR